MTTTKTLEEIALENAQNAYQYAVVNGSANPDAEAEKAYNRTLKSAKGCYHRTIKSAAKGC